MQLSRNKKTRNKHFERVHRLVFYSITLIFLFSLCPPKYFQATDPPVSLSLHLKSHLIPQYKKQKLREERERVQNKELCLPNMGRFYVELSNGTAGKERHCGNLHLKPLPAYFPTPFLPCHSYRENINKNSV